MRASSMENVTIIAGDAQISDHQISLSDYELLMLATIIYCEAGNPIRISIVSWPWAM